MFFFWTVGGAPGGNPELADMRTPPRSLYPGIKPGTSHCDATVLTTTKTHQKNKRVFSV